MHIEKYLAEKCYLEFQMLLLINFMTHWLTFQ